MDVDEDRVAISTDSQLRKCYVLTSINLAQTAGEHKDLLLPSFSVLFISCIFYSALPTVMWRSPQLTCSRCLCARRHQFSGFLSRRCLSLDIQFVVVPSSSFQCVGGPGGRRRIVIQILPLDVPSTLFDIMILFRSLTNCSEVSALVSMSAIISSVGQYTILIVPSEILSRV